MVKAAFQRGDIVWADLEPTKGHEQRGRRPVLIISEDIFNAASGTVIAFALTSQSQRAPYPLTWKLAKIIDKKEAWVKMGQIRTLSTERLGKKLGSVPSAELANILEGFSEIIGL